MKNVLLLIITFSNIINFLLPLFFTIKESDVTEGQPVIGFDGHYFFPFTEIIFNNLEYLSGAKESEGEICKEADLFTALYLGKKIFLFFSESRHDNLR